MYKKVKRPIVSKCSKCLCKWQSSHLYKAFDPSSPSTLQPCGADVARLLQRHQKETSDMPSHVHFSSSSLALSEPRPMLWLTLTLKPLTCWCLCKRKSQVWLFIIFSQMSVTSPAVNRHEHLLVQLQQLVLN